MCYLLLVPRNKWTCCKVKTSDMASVTSQIQSKSDVLYRRLILSSFFSKGWGNIEDYKRLFECRNYFNVPSKCSELATPSHPVSIDRSWKKDSYYVAEGHFLSPVAKHMPGLLPKESEIARFQVITPTKWQDKNKKPICIQLAGTGDHFYWRRRNFMAKPLIHDHCIASIILENPFYGLRKPADQQRSSLKYVIDLFIMGASLILESSVLLHWCERQGYGPLGITGVSMGGNMASLAATVWPKPLAVIPCLSWSTASCVFTKGVMKDSLPWKKLENQLEDDAYRENIIKFAGLNEEVNANNLFAGNASFPGRVDMNADFSMESERKSDHLMKLLEDNDQHGMNQSQTMYLEKKHIYHSIKKTLLDYVPEKIGKSMDETQKINPETVQFMNLLMDRATHLKNFPCPQNPALAKFIAAERDAYVPRDCIDEPGVIWPGSEVLFTDTGHIGAFLTNLSLFRSVIKEKLDQVVM